ncbi:hypothetical protein V6N11_039649 [Hibiscus sabdariffa]|uniref:Reverse transcriptase zinc-binding domain-containing protein n=1 Tax=Hibiscus sabdariffa TaxID=183260 RepID=A0ABR2SNM5_9ROSI
MCESLSQLIDMYLCNILPLKLFLIWCLRRRLLTNAERCRRNLSASSLCIGCSDAAETALHLLRDCRDTRRLWKQLIPKALEQHFFSTNLQA